MYGYLCRRPLLVRKLLKSGFRYNNVTNQFVDVEAQNVIRSQQMTSSPSLSSALQQARHAVDDAVTLPVAAQVQSPVTLQTIDSSPVPSQTGAQCSKTSPPVTQRSTTSQPGAQRPMALQPGPQRFVMLQPSPQRPVASQSNAHRSMTSPRLPSQLKTQRPMTTIASSKQIQNLVPIGFDPTVKKPTAKLKQTRKSTSNVDDITANALNQYEAVRNAPSAAVLAHRQALKASGMAGPRLPASQTVAINKVQQGFEPASQRVAVSVDGVTRLPAPDVRPASTPPTQSGVRVRPVPQTIADNTSIEANLLNALPTQNNARFVQSSVDFSHLKPSAASQSIVSAGSQSMVSAASQSVVSAANQSVTNIQTTAIPSQLPELTLDDVMQVSGMTSQVRVSIVVC